jgi:hypothetical protein
LLYQNQSCIAIRKECPVIASAMSCLSKTAPPSQRIPMTVPYRIVPASAAYFPFPTSINIAIDEDITQIINTPSLCCAPPNNLRPKLEKKEN